MIVAYIGFDIIWFGHMAFFCKFVHQYKKKKKILSEKNNVLRVSLTTKYSRLYGCFVRIVKMHTNWSKCSWILRSPNLPCEYSIRSVIV